MYKKICYTVIIIVLLCFHGGSSEAAVSAGARYGYSSLFAEYADPGYSLGADLSYHVNRYLSFGLQFCRNVYEPPPACELFGGDCRWKGSGSYNIYEVLPFLRLISPRTEHFPAAAFIIAGPAWYGISRDIEYYREGASAETKSVRHDFSRIGMALGCGLVFDDYRSISLEFSPVLKLAEDMDGHLDIYMGIRYYF
jgi:hypothetical protein